MVLWIKKLGKSRRRSALVLHERRATWCDDRDSRVGDFDIFSAIRGLGHHKQTVSEMTCLWLKSRVCAPFVTDMCQSPGIGTENQKVLRQISFPSSVIRESRNFWLFPVIGYVREARALGRHNARTHRYVGKCPSVTRSRPVHHRRVDIRSSKTFARVTLRNHIFRGT